MPPTKKPKAKPATRKPAGKKAKKARKPKQDTKRKKAPGWSHVAWFKRVGQFLYVKFKNWPPTYRYPLGAVRAAGVLAQMKKSAHPGKVVWRELRWPGEPFTKV